MTTPKWFTLHIEPAAGPADTNLRPATAGRPWRFQVPATPPPSKSRGADRRNVKGTAPRFLPAHRAARLALVEPAVTTTRCAAIVSPADCRSDADARPAAGAATHLPARRFPRFAQILRCT